jgi:hypothetical protein
MSRRNRRTFLHLLGAGGLGLAAWLMPVRALAWRHRRRCSAPPVECLPEPLNPPDGAPIRVALAISVDYPKTGDQVPGGGNYCIWGPRPGTTGLSATVTWSGGSANGSRITNPPATKYAFSFSGCPRNISLTLVVKDGSGNQSGPVTFSCV